VVGSFRAEGRMKRHRGEETIGRGAPDSRWSTSCWMESTLAGGTNESLNVQIDIEEKGITGESTKRTKSLKRGRGGPLKKK